MKCLASELLCIAGSTPAYNEAFFVCNQTLPELKPFSLKTFVLRLQ